MATIFCRLVAVLSGFRLLGLLRCPSVGLAPGGVLDTRAADHGVTLPFLTRSKKSGSAHTNTHGLVDKRPERAVLHTVTPRPAPDQSFRVQPNRGCLCSRAHGKTSQLRVIKPGPVTTKSSHRTGIVLIGSVFAVNLIRPSPQNRHPTHARSGKAICRSLPPSDASPWLGPFRGRLGPRGRVRRCVEAGMVDFAESR